MVEGRGGEEKNRDVSGWRQGKSRTGVGVGRGRERAEHGVGMVEGRGRVEQLGEKITPQPMQLVDGTVGARVLQELRL